MTDYKELATELKVISEDVKYSVSILSNASALIYEKMEDLNWCGFYLSTGKKLVLGPFQGKIACTAIDFGTGVCGTAYAKDETVLVDDVHCFDGHIACDSASNSEIVVPVHVKRKLYGVLDIDSPQYSRFSQADKEGLEKTVKILEGILDSL